MMNQLPLWNMYQWHRDRMWNGIQCVVRVQGDSVKVFEDIQPCTREIMLATLTYVKPNS